MLSWVKLKVKGVVEDERAMDVGGRAAMAAFRVLMPVLGLASLAMFMAGEGEFYYVRALGIVLGYVTCLGLVVYVVAYGYYERKFGG